MNCYSKEKRIQICNKYNVKFISHNMNFDEKPIKSDTGYDIQNDYCIFNVSNDFVNENIICGSEAYNHFAQLLNIKIPPIMYSLNTIVDKNNNNEKQSINKETNNIEWNKITKQFYIAISLFIDYYNIKYSNDNYIYLLKDKKYKYYYNKPYDDEVYRFNKILQKFKTSMPIILDKVKNKMRIKHLNFNELANIIINKYPNEKQNFI